VAYQRHLARFQGRTATLVEIGIDRGGSLQLWRTFLGPQVRVIGVDIDPACKAFEEDGIEVLIGDQGDPEFLAELAAHAGPIDVLIDDGGHTMEQQLTTFDVLYPTIVDDGVYVCEDACSSYWAGFGGGLRRPGTLIERMKALVDDLNAWYAESEGHVETAFTRTVASIHFYSALVVVEKAMVEPPQLMMADGAGAVGYASAKPVLDSVRRSRGG
jgi:hypothetical protein